MSSARIGVPPASVWQWSEAHWLTSLRSRGDHDRAPGASIAGGNAGRVLLLDRMPQVDRRLAEGHAVPLLADRPGAGRSRGAAAAHEALMSMFAGDEIHAGSAHA